MSERILLSAPSRKRSAAYHIRRTAPRGTQAFVATLKTELLYRERWPTREAARIAIFEYLEGFYNRRRLHSALGYKSPAEFEEGRMRETVAA